MPLLNGSTAQPTSSSAVFTGGIAVNGQPSQSQAVLNLADDVKVTGNIKVNPTHVSFIDNKTLAEQEHILMYAGQFLYAGTLKVHFGYRLPEGTLVLNEQPIDITILP